MEEMTINEEEVCFYHELGKAIASWAWVEFALMQVMLASLLGRKNYPAMASAFFEIQNFRSKLAFLDEVVSKSNLVATQQRREWRPLFDWCEQAAKKRNHLAHRYVMPFRNAEVGRRWVLLQWVPKGKPPKIMPKVANPPASGIGVRGIIAYQMEFGRLQVSLMNYAARIGLKPEQPLPESSGQPIDPPTIRDIASRIHATLGHPPKPLRRKP